MADNRIVSYRPAADEFGPTPGQLEAEVVFLRAERMRLARELEHRATTLQRIFDACPAAISVHSFPDLTYVEVNRALEASGLSASDMVGHTPQELGIWTDPTDIAQFIRELEEKGRCIGLETTLHLRDKTIPALVSGELLEIDGRPCVVATTLAIRGLKNTQRDLIAAREAAIAASRAKSQFLSSMSHEIRTPLNAVLGMSDLLSETELNPEQRRYLDIVLSNGTALLALINDILDLAKVESGQLALERTAFDLHALVAKVADTAAVRTSKQVAMVVQIAPDVPVQVLGDSLRLRQILLNLLSNAVKFTMEGEIALSVEPAEAPAPDEPSRDDLIRLRFAVADTGIGIAADKLDAIFANFTQAEASTTRKYGGTGLGLAIVRQLTHLFGGTVKVESSLGKGSTFSFTAEFGRAPILPMMPSAPPADLAQSRVLIADDTATNHLILSKTLSAEGALVTCVESGQAALAEIDRAARRGTPYELLLLDCVMPEMDGIEVAGHIRHGNLPASRQPVILMLTSDDRAVTVSRAWAAGIDGHLTKPIRRRDLIDAVNQTRSKARMIEAGGSPIVGRPAESRITPSPNIGSLRILLVDDSADNRLLVAAYLRNAPFMLVEAADGDEAVALFKQERFDLVLMDLQMPKMDGYSATRAIREFERQAGRAPTPIIALTASAVGDAIDDALEAGCDLHVAKPIKKITLLNAIRDLLNQRGGPATIAAQPLTT